MKTKSVRAAAALVALVLGVAASGGDVRPAAQAGLLVSEFVSDRLPTPSAHASTIVEIPGGLVVAWFGGTRESASDVGIWLARFVGGAWTKPVEVATGLEPDGRRFPCWNPVLFRTAAGSLRLFYKVGPQPARWWGMVAESRDEGRTWSPGVRLPEGLLGPIKNKPLQLADGTIVSPSSTESVDAVPIWRVHFEKSVDSGASWTRVSPPESGGIHAIQPALLKYSDGRLQAIGRSRSARLFETWSTDGGQSWSPLALLDVPNPNAGIDAVTLADGRQLLVYNHTRTGRTPLNVAVSRDGRTWTPVFVLEDQPGEYSYPAVIQTRDGSVHVTYTWQRRNIKHAALDPAAWR